MLQRWRKKRKVIGDGLREAIKGKVINKYGEQQQKKLKNE